MKFAQQLCFSPFWSKTGLLEDLRGMKQNFQILGWHHDVQEPWLWGYQTDTWSGQKVSNNPGKLLGFY